MITSDCAPTTDHEYPPDNVPSAQQGLTVGTERLAVPKEEIPTRMCFRTTDPSERIDIVLGSEGLAGVEPTTVGQLFKDTVTKIPDHAALKYKEGQEWKVITYSEYYGMVIKAAKSFLKVSFLMLRCACASEVYGCVFVCLQLLKDQ